jgi:2-keto-4-pentenoate hydratase
VTRDHELAAEVMFAAARSGRLYPAGLPVFDGLRPDDVDAGLGVQLEVLGRWEGEGEALGGWKIGLTSRDGRDSMGAGFRPFGYVLASRILRTGATIAAAEAGNYLLEPEIGLTLGAPIGGDVTVEQARAAVQSVHASFEIIQRRVPASARRPVIRLSDGLGQWGVVMGPGHPVPTSLADLTVELFHDGVLVGSGGAGPGVIDDPFMSLVRVCRQLDRYGRRLEAGQRVITGSLLDPVPLDSTGTWEARFGSLGTVSLNIA